MKFALIILLDNVKDHIKTYREAQTIQDISKLVNQVNKTNNLPSFNINYGLPEKIRLYTVKEIRRKRLISATLIILLCSVILAVMF